MGSSLRAWVEIFRGPGGLEVVADLPGGGDMGGVDPDVDL